MSKRRKKNNISNKFIKVITYLILLIIVFNVAENYEINSQYVNGKINLILNNEHITNELKNDLFINEKNVIYISEEDVKKLFDPNIIYDELNNYIITTHGDKVAKLPIGENIIKMNGWDVDILSGAMKKEGKIYIPITLMDTIYELDMEYIEKEQILVLDYFVNKLIKANISKKCNVKYKTSSLSKTVDKLEKADEVIVIEHLNSNWTKIRTKNGKIGYVKTRRLQNETYIRKDFNT